MNIISIIIAIIIFSILILIHEFGHFLLAKKNGVCVIEFSLGMGPRLLSFKKGETRYSLKAIPFGGYCMMLSDEMLNEENEIEEGYDMERSYDKKSVWARISIIAAGPIFNFLLAFVAAIIVIGFTGMDPAFVDYVEADSPAAQAGLEPGDVITRYNGVKVSVGRDIYLEEYLNPTGKSPIELTVEREGEELNLTVQPAEKQAFYLGMQYQADEDPASVTVSENSALEQAGVKTGDVITKIDGTEIPNGKEMSAYLRAHPISQTPLTITAERDGTSMEFTVTPQVQTYYETGFTYNLYKLAGKNLNITVDSVAADGAAAQAGLTESDRIVSVNGRTVVPGMGNDIYDQILDSKGTPLSLEVEDADGNKRSLTITPKKVEAENADSEDTYDMGFTCTMLYEGKNGLDVLGGSFTEIAYQVRTTFRSLAGLFTGKVGVKDMSGPVGIVDVISDTVEETSSEGVGLTLLTLLNFLILLNANLAVMNLLPLPALDGGKLVFLLIEAIRGKPVPREKEGMVHFVGMILLMLLMVFILYQDIVKLFQ